MPKKSYLELFEFRVFFIDFRHDCINLTCMYILTNSRFRYKKNFELFEILRVILAQVPCCHLCLVLVIGKVPLGMSCHIVRHDRVFFLLLLEKKNYVLVVRKMLLGFKNFPFLLKKNFFCEVLRIVIH